MHVRSMLAGAGIWIAACQLESFYAYAPARVMLASGMLAAYTLLIAREVWYARDKELISRWPTLRVPLPKEHDQPAALSRWSTWWRNPAEHSARAEIRLASGRVPFYDDHYFYKNENSYSPGINERCIPHPSILARKGRNRSGEAGHRSPPASPSRLLPSSSSA